MSRRLVPFVWHTFDVASLLPPDWQELLLAIARDCAVDKTLVPRSVTSREAPDVREVPVAVVGGEVLRARAPWLFALYERDFRALAQAVSAEPVVCATRDRIAINLNVQRGLEMRYEAHVDSNPLEGLLYVTTHPPGTGGELVVAQSADVVGVSAIDGCAAQIFPVAGHLVFFDARTHPHYVRELRDRSAVRVVAAMNFYTPSCPETARPADLDEHLFGKN